MADQIRQWSDELARDPSSLAFLQLGEALRRKGQLDLAMKIAIRGLERHPHHADAHDLLARISADRGELERAFDEWDVVLRLVPTHVGAMKGLGFVCFQQGRHEEAERYLKQAAEQGADGAAAAGLANLRRSTTMRAVSEEDLAATNGSGAEPPAISSLDTATNASPPNVRAESAAPISHGYAPDDARALFADVLGDQEQTALLLDAQGMVLAGMYLSPDGHDVGQDVGAELSGVSDAAVRATRHLDIGSWRSIVLETDIAVINLAPAGAGELLVLAASRSIPLGLVRRVLDRCLARAREWMQGRQ
jgi:tetratricopeptide (TPR) repeat protein